MTCHELVQLVTEYLEGELPESDRRRFERHLAECEDCSRYLQQMRQTIELTGLREGSLQPEARDALVRTFEQWRRERS
jgi:anti-sigma factor RsiW